MTLPARLICSRAGRGFCFMMVLVFFCCIAGFWGGVLAPLMDEWQSAAFLRGALPQVQWVGYAASRSSTDLRISRRILAPLMTAAAAAWQPPAAKEGQGDCDFPLGPPWILLYPLKRRRSARGLEAAKRRVLTRRSAVGARWWYVALRSAVALQFCGAFLRR